jgi:hypothetical protein
LDNSKADQSSPNKKGDPQPRSPYQQNQQLPKTFGYGTIRYFLQLYEFISKSKANFFYNCRNIASATSGFPGKSFSPSQATVIQNLNGQKTSVVRILYQ